MSFERYTPAIRVAPALVWFSGMLAIPFYFGVIHLPVRQLFIYSFVSGFALTAGLHLERLPEERPTANLLMASFGSLTVLTALIGGTAYLIALAF